MLGRAEPAIAAHGGPTMALRGSTSRSRLPLLNLFVSQPISARPLMDIRRGSWTPSQWAIVIALMLAGGSVLSYPGGTVRDESTRVYSFTHNFLSDLGSTVAFNGQPNVAGAVLFGLSILIMVLVLAGSIVVAVRLLSATPRARPFARLAAVASVLVCAGFLGVALTPADRAWSLHIAFSRLAFWSFPVTTALLSIATARDARFRPRATVGWVTLTIVLAGLIAMARLGPTADTEHGLVTRVITQKIMAVSVLVVLWVESREAEVVSSRESLKRLDQPAG